MKGGRLGKDAILFDNDDTLYTVSGNFREEVVQKMSIYLSDKLGMLRESVMLDRQRLIKKHEIESTERVFNIEYGIDIADFIANSYLAVDLNKYIKKDRQLARFLEELGVRKSVLTNNPREFAEAVLKRLDIFHLFEKVIGNESVGYNIKPNKRAFAKALEITGYQKSSTLLVDDKIANCIAAESYGITAVLMGGNSERVTHSVNDVYQIKNILR